MIKTALVAGTNSGCGKTTTMLALLQYFRRKQTDIVSFKTGPDFLDPIWHQAITGKASYNLDTKMMSAEHCRRLLHQGAEVALIEGVMGLFDGYAGVGGPGSSVDLAHILGCPVLLVVDAYGLSGTIAALVAGCCRLAEDKNVRISGVIANRTGGAYHAELLQQALAEYHLPPLVAWLERSDTPLSERHLGLTMPDEASIPDFQSILHVNESGFTDAFSELTVAPSAFQAKIKPLKKTIAIARDQACCFIYQANLDWLRTCGATLVFFSPLAGESVPFGADAIWLPGGYPELHAAKLSESASWSSIRRCAEDGLPILAECGGAMLLGKALVDINGKQWPMAGLLPYDSVMQPRLSALGHRQEASGIKGHEFHYSTRKAYAELPPAFTLEKGDPGVRYQNVRASYVHWYFPSSGDQALRWFDK